MLPDVGGCLKDGETALLIPCDEEGDVDGEREKQGDGGHGSEKEALHKPIGPSALNENEARDDEVPPQSTPERGKAVWNDESNSATRFMSRVPRSETGMALDKRLPAEYAEYCRVAMDYQVHCGIPDSGAYTLYPETPEEVRESKPRPDSLYGNSATISTQGPYEFIPPEGMSRRHPRLMSMFPDLVNGAEMDSIAACVASNEARSRFKEPSVRREDIPHREPLLTGKYSDADIPTLRERWYREYEDMMSGVPERMPPQREVNHEINLDDETKRYSYYSKRTPEVLREQLKEKTERYLRAEWWMQAPSGLMSQAAPMLCIAKKDGKLRTVVDLRQRNENTVKDVTPLPDMDAIRDDVARALYVSKIDLSDAYEQVRIIARDIWKTAFANSSGVFLSNVMQQGDCNAPATFQRLMTAIFRDILGDFVHVYLDDIFVFSNSVDDHERHLECVLSRLREQQLYMKRVKCELYAERVECLGHFIDKKGLHADMDKMAKIRNWRQPREYNDIQRFVGLVNYVAAFLPDIAAYTTPLMEISQGGRGFVWRPLHERCFQMIKHICCKVPVLRPIVRDSKEPIWLICDASKTGVGAMLGQGPTWDTCRPAGFMSKKFSSAQHHYAVHERETLAILEALMKWEDKLIGTRLHVVTDHKALEFFQSQRTLSSRQWRWTQYMARFDFDITYVMGEDNKVADCLSRYYENDELDEVHSVNEYVRADVRMDPSGEELPMERAQEWRTRAVEMRAMETMQVRRSRRLQERQEVREIEAAELEDHRSKTGSDESAGNTEHAGSTLASNAGTDMTVGEMLDLEFNDVHMDLPEDELRGAIMAAYAEDPVFGKFLADPRVSNVLILEDGLIWHPNIDGSQAIGVPKGRFGEQSI